MKQFNFTANKNDLVNELEKIKQSFKVETLIEKWQFLSPMIFSANSGARLGAGKQIFLFIDGAHKTTDPVSLNEQIRDLEKEGIKVVVVAIGQNEDAPILKDIIGDAYFFPEDLPVLKRMVKPIQSAVIKSKFFIV